MLILGEEQFLDASDCRLLQSPIISGFQFYDAALQVRALRLLNFHSVVGLLDAGNKQTQLLSSG